LPGRRSLILVGQRIRRFTLLMLIASFGLLAAATPLFAQGDTRAWAKEALQKALAAAEKNPLAGDRSAFNRRAVILMCRLDPQAALPVLPDITRSSDAIEALGTVAAALAPQDQAKAQVLIARAVKLLSEIPDDDQRAAALALLCRQIATFDPASAFAALAGIEKPLVFERAWLSLARINPAAALTDYQTKITLPAQKERLAAGLLPILAPVDLVGALALAENISDPLLKSQALTEAALALPPEAALGLTQRIPDIALRHLAIRAAAEKLAPTNLPVALTAIEELGPEAEAARAGVALALARQDPTQAQELISKLTVLPVRRDAYGLLLKQLAESNFPAARALADNPEIPAWALPAYCEALAKTDLAAAFTRANALPEEGLRSLALAKVAQAAAASSPDLAEKILWETNAEDRQPALQALVIALAPTALKKATGLTGLTAEADQVPPLLMAIAQSIAPANPAEALRLAQAGAPSPERSEVLLQLAAQLAARDQKQALTVAEAAVGKAGGGRSLAGRLAQTNPGLAISWANGIEDHFQRAWAFCDIAETLLSPSKPSPTLERTDIQRVVEAGGAAPENSAPAGDLKIIQAAPGELTVQLADFAPDSLYTIQARSKAGDFTWENLKPQPGGIFQLRDDGHLQVAQRLRCSSRGMATDPAYFDDLSKGQEQGKSRFPYGVPVSTFGGPGFLASAPTWVERDGRGGFWIYQDLRPWRVVSFDENFHYRFTLVFPHRLLALASDPQAKLYVLEEGNYLSCFDADGRPLHYWQLPEGHGKGEFIQASGLAIDPFNEGIYLADEKLGRVQSFDDTMSLRPLPMIPWGWLGREDLAYLEAGAYDENSKYRLDRPRRLAWGPGGVLYADCAYYVMRFDLATGEQVPFGVNGVLGWGGTFSDSAHSTSAGANAHWQEHMLAGVNPQGDIYIADTANAYRPNLRLQRFAPDGTFLDKYDLDREITAADGSRIYLTPPLGLAFAKEKTGVNIWLAEGGDRVYESINLTSGGKTYLGPGAPGKQFDLTQLASQDLTITRQTGPLPRKSEGPVVTFAAGRRGTLNCEAERNAELPNGATSIWLPTRLGAPFTVTLWEENRLVPASNFTLEIETAPGVFGTQYDFFRVTNKSGHTWKNIRFVAETASNQ
jgi:hypothetical protein